MFVSILITKLKFALFTYDLNINEAKTKILVISRHDRQGLFSFGGERLQNPRTFPYLRSRISSDGKSKTEIISCTNHVKIFILYLSIWFKKYTEFKKIVILIF